MAKQLADEKNLIMGLLKDESLQATLKKTLENAGAVSEKAVALAEDAEGISGTAGETAALAKDFLSRVMPSIEEIVAKVLNFQADLAVLIREELEDITQAVKNIFIIRWYLEDEPHEDPILRRPILLHSFKKAPTPQSREE
jgi:hypothetical protein